MFSFCCHWKLKCFNRSVIKYALKCLLRNEIPVRLYEMEAHQFKALILIQGCNVDVMCYGNAHCMLALKLPGEFSGAFKHMNIFTKIILLQYKLFCCCWWNMNGEFKGFASEPGTIELIKSCEFTILPLTSRSICPQIPLCCTVWSQLQAGELHSLYTYYYSQ